MQVSFTTIPNSKLNFHSTSKMISGDNLVPRDFSLVSGRGIIYEGSVSRFNSLPLYIYIYTIVTEEAPISYIFLLSKDPSYIWSSQAKWISISTQPLHSDKKKNRLYATCNPQLLQTELKVLFVYGTNY